jgi:hypothetical protein
MDKLNVAFSSDYKAGSNPGALFDYADKLGHNCNYFARDVTTVASELSARQPYDIVVINNKRNLGGLRGKLVVNTQHGNLGRHSTRTRRAPDFGRFAIRERNDGA